MAVEVRLPEQLFRGAWWHGELLSTGSHHASVRLTAFASRDGAAERLVETVRPPPEPARTEPGAPTVRHP